MKNLIYATIAASALILMAGCADEPRHTSTTTTEETVVHRPVAPVTTTTETTRSVQPY